MFKEGQEIWILEEPDTYYKKTVSDCIRQCVYRKEDRPGRHLITYLRDGKLGMGTSVGGDQLFGTLEELKKKLIAQKAVKMSQLLKEVNGLGEDITYIQSLKDVKEDREKKLGELLRDTQK